MAPEPLRRPGGYAGVTIANGIGSERSGQPERPDPPGTPVVDDRRRAEIDECLGQIRDRIARACVASGRHPSEVTLIAVTKTYPVQDVFALAALGVRDIGENRDQEAALKAAMVADAGVAVRWHFVGQLQRNKCRSVVRYADLVHSVDGVALAGVLAREAARRRERALDVLVQVSLDDDPERGGVFVDDRAVDRSEGVGLDRDADRGFDEVVAAVMDSSALRLRGLMVVAPPDWDPDSAFERVAELAERVRAADPDATIVSAGMSSDLEPAIRWGATHVRIGSALLGKRAPLG
jgi:pyridoxal phosphate enzyme (YggS family)